MSGYFPRDRRLSPQIPAREAHDDSIFEAAILVDGIPPATLHLEADSGVDLARAFVASEDVEFDAMQVHGVEADPAKHSHGVRAIAPIPVALVANADAKSAAAVFRAGNRDTGAADTRAVFNGDDGEIGDRLCGLFVLRKERALRR